MTEPANTIEDSLELSFLMLPKIGQLYDSLTPEYVNLSKLRHYEELFGKPESLRGEDLEALGMQTLRAMDLAVDYLYVANRFAKYAHLQYDRKAAHVYFVGAPEYLSKAGVKDSHSARDKYCDQEPSFLECKNLRDSWEALTEWLQNKYQIFNWKHQWVKAQINMIVKGQ